jgi:alpha-N-arabinofuranosidase
MYTYPVVRNGNYGWRRSMNRIVVGAAGTGIKIDRNIYGHFAEHLGRCIYEGIWVGEDSPIPNIRGIRKDVVAALKAIKIPVLRWPGGCFADEYHWMDGIGPRQKRPSIVNTHWGGVTENNHFGTHEFLDLCEQLGTEAYICGNVGSGTVKELADWVQYVTFEGQSPMADLRRANGRDAAWKVKYWGIGNENWGCGGNMRPEYYADEYRRYQTFTKNFSGNQLYKIACGSYNDNYNWTEVLMKQAGQHMNGLALHYYTCPKWKFKKPSSATEFVEMEWAQTMTLAMRMEELVTKHSAIMDTHDPEKKVAMVVDEWGTWWDVEPGTNPGFLYQQNTQRDALVAGMTLNIFNNHADRVRMANIAQTINVLQAMILTEGAKMILTPSYHVFEMYKAHQDAELLESKVFCGDYALGEEKAPTISASASKAAGGAITVTLTNCNPNKKAEVTLDIAGGSIGKVSARVLTTKKMGAHNTFEKPNTVKPEAFKEFTKKKDSLVIEMPAKSVMAVTIG